ncbi:MerR family transcriptional regulator [bacterium]|nr:MerR family transcriptional regulator [bacterium]
MSYTVQQLSRLAGVSVRTLHHYDKIKLLSPATREKNGYRKYEEKDLLILQQILFFKELEFSLNEIKHIINNPKFTIASALREHQEVLQIKRKRINTLLKTINKTLINIAKKNTMHDEELYGGLTKEEKDLYEQEVKNRWGHTSAYMQSQERTKNWKKEDYARMKESMETFMQKLIKVMPSGSTSEETQKLIDEHYNSLRAFYDPTIEMYRGLANMYIEDPRFTAFYEKYAKGLATFMRDAMLKYCDDRS